MTPAQLAKHEQDNERRLVNDRAYRLQQIASEYAYWQAAGKRISPALREVIPMYADEATLTDFQDALPQVHEHTVRVEWNRMKREWADMGSADWKGAR